MVQATYLRTGDHRGPDRMVVTTLCDKVYQ
jgi:hypothetical protein